MAKLAAFKRIIKEDFEPQYANIIENIGFSVNQFAQDVYNAFLGKINFENMNMKVATVVISVDASGVPEITTSFKSNINGNVIGIICIRAENQSNSNTYPNGQPFISWIEENNIITIKNVKGLQASNKYRLTLLLIGN